MFVKQNGPAEAYLGGNTLNEGKAKGKRMGVSACLLTPSHPFSKANI